ncbi:YkuS family protein [Clostridium formicaceticum]|uniref:YkuS family protein n=1 Tax=Clostridium formicaceticum TaxID=1497 RepID=A0AAC9RMC4_9CLOT|nr:YkuS family protein [Clostridium formicaceticum]AOY77444.1 hypothetical protein BJL90_17245 [Clostridium formicaceticum]ARE88000.1 hypothetical protein CLFO_24010 [Clostridium formicaceticum]
MQNKLVAVQEGLHEVAEVLRRKGYKVTTIDEAEEPIDAIIYSNHSRHYLAHNMTGKINIPSYNQFVKMVNIDEIGIENIATFLKELE